VDSNQDPAQQQAEPKTTSTYWDSFYSQPATVSRRIPSQFAAFVAQEYSSRFNWIAEFGCGAGRDALFFAQLGLNVVGIDASPAAIETCLNQRNNLRPSGHATFAVGRASEEASFELVTTAAPREPLLWYARFFLHAISEPEEIQYFHNLSRACQSRSVVALEFRTVRDQSLEKVTPAHYRRFICPLSLIQRVLGLGFRLEYFVEGFGFAKHQRDDAYVARLILEKV
jgi:SAM-dependent methyltransferase